MAVVGETHFNKMSLFLALMTSNIFLAGHDVFYFGAMSFRFHISYIFFQKLLCDSFFCERWDVVFENPILFIWLKLVSNSIDVYLFVITCF